MMEKDALRVKYTKLRDQLSQEQIEELSLQIVNKTLELPIWEAEYYHLFLPILAKKEVNTEYLLHILQGKDKSVVVSQSNFQTGDLRHILLQENTSIKVSSYGIPEPVSGIELTPKVIDVVFVPLLAFDLSGKRIGYGKGFYDRFLAACRTNSIFIGLSFFAPEKSVPDTGFDIPLHYCVSPDKIFYFS